MSEVNQSAELTLKPCPFCSGIANWCSDNDPTNVHTCHLIVCTGCGLQFDTTENPDYDIAGLKQYIANKWNNRV